MPSDEGLRRILAYTTLFGFIFFIFFYGIAQSLSGMSTDFRPLGKHQGFNPRMFPDNQWRSILTIAGLVVIPDFSRYKFMRNLSVEDFPIGV
jgi:hypothetical protein